METGTRFGLNYGWGRGAPGWNVGMDENLLKLDQAGIHLSVKSRASTSPPATPVSQDTYIVGASATGAWLGKDSQVAIYHLGAWKFYQPRLGWAAYVEDEEVLTVYKGPQWSAGVAI